ncbi:MAG: antibiotic biosynthesis monooxygenase [Muribaculaceae bacterium]|nr:antibiotic biosynthesis monooxygenase [Muribaculaceae bacterium]
MIRLNVSIVIPDSACASKIIDAATELVELSLHDKGCIGYDLYRSLTNDDRLMIVETWQDAKSLDVHQQSEHFRRIVPQLEEMGAMTLERFDF